MMRLRAQSVSKRSRCIFPHQGRGIRAPSDSSSDKGPGPSGSRSFGDVFVCPLLLSSVEGSARFLLLLGGL